MKSRDLCGYAEAAYGCGNWLDGAEYMRLARIAAAVEEEDDAYSHGVDDHTHHVTFVEPTGPEPETWVVDEVEANERAHARGRHHAEAKE
jgi:hypothetical protein